MPSKSGTRSAPPGATASASSDAPPNYAYRIAFPDVFTPNGDGVNDLFRPLELYDLDWDWLEIYDRWGRRVFESRSPWPGWDGEGAPPGVYPYRLRFRRPVTGEAAYLAGTLTLLR
jgi:gliding motility-associated-like protein